MINENFFAPKTRCQKCSTDDNPCDDWVLVDIFDDDEQDQTPRIEWACASCDHRVKVTWVLTTAQLSFPDCECEGCEQEHKNKTLDAMYEPAEPEDFGKFPDNDE